MGISLMSVITMCVILLGRYADFQTSFFQTLQRIWWSGQRQSHLKTTEVLSDDCVSNYLISLGRRKMDHLPSDVGGGAEGRGNSRGGVSVPLEWRRWWGRGARGLELCGTCFSLSLTIAVSPVMSCHCC